MDAFQRAGPNLLDPNAVRPRRLWLEKMLPRAAKGDVERGFRRHWLLSALLDDHCAFRERWCLGPMQTLLALERESPDDLAVVGAAFEPGATLEAIAVAVALVVPVQPGTHRTAPSV